MEIHSSEIATPALIVTREDGGAGQTLQSPILIGREPAQEEVMQFLTHSRSFGSIGQVERTETAQSVLFMTGPYCFKLLRQRPAGTSAPLTLEQRHRLASEEIRLGRLYAPDLYLRLVPVRKHGAGFSLDLPGGELQTRPTHRSPSCDTAPIVEWLILLRRYDISKNYDRMVDVIQPNFTECQQLARLIAPGNLPFAAVESASSWFCVLEDMICQYEPLVRQIDRSSKQNTLRACLARAKSQLDRVAALIEHRGTRGLIRPIHGNVNLSNVIALPEGLHLVNPRVHSSSPMQISIGDPFYDLASMISELWSRGLTRQANWVFAHFCNEMFDSHALDGLQALDLYIFLHSLCDADMRMQRKSDMLALGTQKGSTQTLDPEVKRIVKTARDSLLQDEAKLIVVSGSNRSERSHFARLLAPVTGRMPGALYLSAEQEMLALFETRDKVGLPPAAHRLSVWELVYGRLADKARQALAAGYSVILEGQYDLPVHRQHLSDLADEMGLHDNLVAFHLVKGRKDNSSLKPIIANRNTADLESQYEQEQTGMHTSLQHLTLADYRDWTQWIDLDATRSVDQLLAQALGHINAVWSPSVQATLH